MRSEKEREREIETEKERERTQDLRRNYHFKIEKPGNSHFLGFSLITTREPERRYVLNHHQICSD